MTTVVVSGAEEAFATIGQVLAKLSDWRPFWKRMEANGYVRISVNGNLVWAKPEDIRAILTDALEAKP